MLVRDVMQRQVTTITPETTVPEAMRLARTRGVRHLPVVEDGELVGIVSDRDLKRALSPEAAASAAPAVMRDALPVARVMTRPVVTIGPQFPVEDAARLMVTGKISALPVTEHGRLVGIVTETDVLELFVRALGAGEPSSRLDVILDDRPSALTEVVRALEAVGLVVSSVMTLGSPTGVREAVVRIATIDPRRAIAALEERGYQVRDRVAR